MKKWIENNWKDPVWSKVFAWGIIGVISLILSGIWILITTIFKSVSLRDSFFEFIELMSKRVQLPIWILFVGFLSIIVWVYLSRNRNKIRILRPTASPKKQSESSDIRGSNSSDLEPTIIQSDKIGLAKQNFSSSINCRILGFQEGVFNIWGYISDIHNKIHPKRRFMYIAGFATNGGHPLNNPGLANYPNAWAIQRLTPTIEDNLGTWRFWCNNIDRELTHLDYDEPLSGGWHLFTIAWSSKEDHIKFLIDTKVVAEDKFKNWPSDLTGSIMIGTWVNRAGTHFFDSKVGPWRFEEGAYSSSALNKYYSNRPE